MMSPEHQSDESLKPRLNWLFYLLILALIALAGKLFDLQVVQGGEYRLQSEEKRLRIRAIQAPRGRLFDHLGRELAGNRAGFTISVVDMGSEDDEEIIKRISGLLDLDPVLVSEKIKQQRYRLFESIKLKSDVDLATVTRIEESRDELPGIMVEVEPYRSYQDGLLSAHLTGYLGEIDADQLRSSPPGYEAGDIIGKTGLESAYESLLRGRDGGEIVEVDATGRPVRTLEVVEPTPGNDLHLTLDLDLQRVTRDALLESIRLVREDPLDPAPEVRSGAAVALDPNTGAILALVSEPSYDPNLMVAGLTLEDWERLQGDPLKPLLNRVIRGAYPPGSAFKMITILSALEKGVLGYDETIISTGVYWRIMPKKDWLPEGHGVVDPRRAIQVSCNIAFYEYGYRAGIDSLSEMTALFGLGDLTGILDLTGETRGHRMGRLSGLPHTGGREDGDRPTGWRQATSCLFVAFAPLDNPRIAVVVLVENGKGGARAAAPVRRAMLESFGDVSG